MATDPRVEKLVAHYQGEKLLQSMHFTHDDLVAAALNVLGHLDAAGLAVINPYQDEEYAEQIKALIFERTQLVDADADDLAWDILHLLRGEA